MRTIWRLKIRAQVEGILYQEANRVTNMRICEVVPRYERARGCILIHNTSWSLNTKLVSPTQLIIAQIIARR